MAKKLMLLTESERAMVNKERERSAMFKELDGMFERARLKVEATEGAAAAARSQLSLQGVRARVRTRFGSHLLGL